MTPRILRMPSARALKIRAGIQRERAERRIFLSILAGAGFPLPIPQFAFMEERDWTLDYAWPDRLIALEVDGAIFARGGHSTGMGIGRDIHKHNDAIVRGWRVLRCVPGDTDIVRYRKRKDGTRGSVEFMIPGLTNFSILRLLRPVLLP